MIKISKELFGMKIDVKYKLKHKKTVRCPYQYVGSDQEGRQYLIVNARNGVQKFYLERSVHYQKEMQQIFSTGKLRLNLPVIEKHIGSEYYVIYQYFENTAKASGTIPETELLELNEIHSQSFPVEEAVVKQIEEGFLCAWPEEYHHNIRGLEAYQRYIDLIKELKEVRVCFEHGDYAVNNVLIDSEGIIWLVDFEFFRMFQPVGFDLYDWHFTTDQNYENVPYYEINSCKYNLINEINDILDKSYVPSFRIQKIEENRDGQIKIKPDFIYNNIKLKGKNCLVCQIESAGEIWQIPVYMEKYKISIGVWLTGLDEEIFTELIHFLFRKLFIYRIEYQYAINQAGHAFETNHWHILLPSKKEELWNRLSSRHRYNMRHKRKKAEEALGRLELIEYDKLIPDSVVEFYFQNKKMQMGTDYHMQPQQYIREYHVTNAYIMQTEKQEEIAVLFACEQGLCVYLENLTYRPAFAMYSPGEMIYAMFLERMVEKGKHAVFLGAGNQEYKRYFGGIETVVWSGVVYRNKIFEKLGMRNEP